MIRISTKSIYDTGVTQMNSLQSSLNKTQMQLSTNRRMLTPSDDPIASARALEVTQSQSINTQLVTNRQNAKNVLSQEDLALTSSANLLLEINGLIVAAGNGTLADGDRKSLAIELEGRMDDLLGVANTADGAGGYLFAGFKTNTQPFSPTAEGATYQGDQGQRQLLVGSARQLATSDTGNKVFENNLSGNGTFTTGADPGNYARGGSGIISGGSVVDGNALTGHNYEIKFTVVAADAVAGTAASTTYVVTDKTTNAPVPDPEVATPYKSGEAIVFDGQQFDIKGNPADGDVFTVEPSTKESVFKTLKDLLNVLRSPGSGPAGQAALTNGLNRAHDLIDANYDSVLGVQAEVGSRLRELDYLDSSGEDMNLQYATTLSDLQDLDTVKAISLFTQQQTTLLAAQKSFTQMSGLSLFNYIS